MVPRNPCTGRVSRKNDGLWLPFNEGRVRNLSGRAVFNPGTICFGTRQPHQMHFRNPPVVQGLCACNLFRKIALGGKGEVRLEGFGAMFRRDRREVLDVCGKVCRV